MKLTFYGGAQSVTGANYLLESGDSKILVDCGLKQGGHLCEEENYKKFEYDPSTVDALFVTHAHIDHVGRIPKLYKEGFRGKIFSTEPTKEFAEELLRDSQDILQREAKRDGKEPLYTDEHIDKVLELWKGTGYHKEIVVKDFKVEFYDAGHILGSAVVVIEAEGKRVVFSGDLGNSPAPMIKNLEKIEKADYLLIETVYGGRVHEDREERRAILEDVIEETVKEGGALMIPAFAMERTQELLFELNSLVENGRIPQVPIFLDSPLAIKLTKIYAKYSNNPEYMKKGPIDLVRGGDALFHFPGLKYTLKTEDSRKIDSTPNPKIIIAGSGMSNGGRIVRHEAKYLPDPSSTLLIIGYQAEGTLGRKLIDGAKEVKVNNQKVQVNARIKAIGGYSSHADQDALLRWVTNMKDSLKKVYLIQGELDQMEPFKQLLVDNLALGAEIPNPGDSIEL